MEQRGGFLRCCWGGFHGHETDYPSLKIPQLGDVQAVHLEDGEAMNKLFLSIVPISLLLVACGGRQLDKIELQTNCQIDIKEQLRDPGSYRESGFNHSITGSKGSRRGTMTMIFRAKNGFGGYKMMKARCEAYEQDGKIYSRATIL